MLEGQASYMRASLVQSGNKRKAEYLSDCTQSAAANVGSAWNCVALHRLHAFSFLPLGATLGVAVLNTQVPRPLRARVESPPTARPCNPSAGPSSKLPGCAPRRTTQAHWHQPHLWPSPPFQNPRKGPARNPMAGDTSRPVEPSGWTQSGLIAKPAAVPGARNRESRVRAAVVPVGAFQLQFPVSSFSTSPRPLAVQLRS